MTNAIAVTPVNNKAAMWFAIIMFGISIILNVITYCNVNDADMEPEPKGGFAPKQKRHSKRVEVLLFSGPLCFVLGISPYLENPQVVEAAPVEKAYGISNVSFDYGSWYDLDPSHRTVSAREQRNHGLDQIWHTIRFTDRHGLEQTGEIKITDSRLYLYVDDENPGYMDPYNVIKVRQSAKDGR